MQAAGQLQLVQADLAAVLLDFGHDFQGKGQGAAAIFEAHFGDGSAPDRL